MEVMAVGRSWKNVHLKSCLMASQKRTGLLEIISKVEEHNINRFNVAIERITGAQCQIKPNEKDTLQINKQQVS